jgi:hypothetical protein
VRTSFYVVFSVILTPFVLLLNCFIEGSKASRLRIDIIFFDGLISCNVTIKHIHIYLPCRSASAVKKYFGFFHESDEATNFVNCSAV